MKITIEQNVSMRYLTTIKDKNIDMNQANKYIKLLRE